MNNTNSTKTTVNSNNSIDPYVAFYSIFSGLTLISLFVAIFLSGSPAWGLQVSGYFLLFLAMIMLLIKINIVKKNPPLPTNYFNIISFGFYLLIMFATIGMKLYLLFVYKDRLTSSNEAYYSYFNRPILGLIIIQSFLLYRYIDNMPPYILSLLCLLGLFNIAAVISEFNVVTFYYADGFCSVFHT